MDLLEPFIGNDLGVAFKADNDEYWFVDSDTSIEASKPYKDLTTKFQITEYGSDTVLLTSASNGKYLSLWISHDTPYIHAAKSEPDEYCYFKVYDCDGKLGLRNTYNDLFLTRFIRDDKNHIEANKGGIDDYSKFIVETGSVTPVKEEILDITWGKIQNLESMKPVIVQTKAVTNNGTRIANSGVEMSWTFTESSETSWESAWGITTGFKTTVSYVFGQSEFWLEINYNGKKGGNKSSTKSKTITENLNFKIPSQKKVTAKFLVARIENAEIDFKATIKRSSEDGVHTFTQNGVWKGVLMFDSNITIDEACPIKRNKKKKKQSCWIIKSSNLMRKLQGKNK